MANTLVLYTGGTLGCYGEPLTPMPADLFLTKLRQAAPFTHQHFDVQATPYILDSSALNASDWCALAAQIQHLQQQGYTQFILIHGTDTMSYACAVLGRLLGQSAKIILTGSQLPLFDTDGNSIRSHSDAQANLTAAFNALDQVENGVYLCFSKRILHASTVLKQHTHDWDAFAGLPYHDQTFKPTKHLGMTMTPALQQKAAAFRYLVIEVTPQPIAHLERLLQLILQDPPHMLVLRGFGSGNLVGSTQLIQLIDQLASHCLCILSTQVPFGQLSQTYAVADWVKQSQLVRNLTPSHADLYAKCLQLYLQYPSPAEWHQHWYTED